MQNNDKNDNYELLDSALSVNDDKTTLQFIYKDFITAKTSDVEISEFIISYFIGDAIEKITHYREELIKEEKNKLPTNKFSNFSSRKETVPLDTRTTEQKLTDLPLKKLLTILESLHISQHSFLDHVYQFGTSRYSYSVTDYKWSSPFGTDGVDSYTLLLDLIQNVNINEDTSTDLLEKIVKLV